MEKIVNEHIKESLYSKTLESGLKVYYMPKIGYTKQYAIFATKYGSIDNKFIPIGEEKPIEVPEGIAHFLEHKLFEEPEGDIFDEFSKIGVDANAFTSFDQTAYVFSSNENFYRALEILVKFVQNPYFTDESIEKEKGIIEQEISMYDDNPGWRVFFNALDAMYFNHPVKIDIAGTKDTIANINKELLIKAYNTFYHPENMVLFVVGDLDFSKIIDVVNKSERKDYKALGVIERELVEEPNRVRKHKVEERMTTSNPIFYIGFKDTNLGQTGKNLIKKDLVTNLILDMLFSTSSIFYNELYEEGLIDGSFGAYYVGKESYGHSFVGGESEDPEEVYRRIIKLIESDSENFLTEEAFSRVKKNEIGGFLQGLNSIDYIATSYVDMYFSNYDMLDYLNLLESIKYEDIIERFNEHFNKENLVLSIINPNKK